RGPNARDQAQGRGRPLRQDRPRDLRLPGTPYPAFVTRMAPWPAPPGSFDSAQAELATTPRPRGFRSLTPTRFSASVPGVPPMAPSNRLPRHAVRVPTYAALEQYVRAFAAGRLNLLLLFGPPGVGKSRCVRQALGNQACWLSGQATPLGIYIQAYQHRHQPL